MISGNIIDRGGVSGSLTVGAGGSNVVINPTWFVGTKIADYEIDGEQGELFAPSPIRYRLIKDVLYNNPSGAPTQTVLPLTHDFSDYDVIYMKISNNTDISNFNIYCHVSFMPIMVNSDEKVSVQALYSQRVVDILFNGATFNVIRVDGDYRNTVYEIVGIKLGAVV